MLQKDRQIWKNVSDSLKRESQFDKKLRKLLGKRVEYFYSDSQKLKEIEKKISLYQEVVGTLEALSGVIEMSIEKEMKKIGIKLVMKEEWPEEIWQSLHTYFDFKGVEYEYKKGDKELLLFRNEEIKDYVGDEYDYIDGEGNPVFGDEELPCNNCVECPGRDECVHR